MTLQYFNQPIVKYYKKFEPVGKFWLTEIEKYNEEPFLKKPSENDWSMGQLYNHLINHTIDIQLNAINGCLLQTNGSIKGGKSFKGLMTFMRGGFPSYKIKSPLNDSYPPKDPKNIMETRNNFIRLLKTMNEISAKLDKLSKEDLKYKVKNERYGMLNAVEWYEVIIMHFKHHLTQKRRIDRTLMR